MLVCILNILILESRLLKLKYIATIYLRRYTQMCAFIKERSKCMCALSDYDFYLTFIGKQRSQELAGCVLGWTVSGQERWRE